MLTSFSSIEHMKAFQKKKGSVITSLKQKTTQAAAKVTHKDSVDTPGKDKKPESGG